MIFPLTIYLSRKKFLFSKILMTSLHVICGLGTLIQKSWVRLCWATASIVLDLNTELKLVSFLKILPRIASSVIELGASNPYIINTPVLPIQLGRRQTSAMKVWKFCCTIVQTLKPGLSTIYANRDEIFSCPCPRSSSFSDQI